MTAPVVTFAQAKQGSDELTLRGIKVTGGAAPGYIPDRVCSMCHPKIYRSYQHVGMARSFYRPKASRFIEDFKNNRFFHEPSQRYYRIDRKGDTLTFKRYQLDRDKKTINMFTRKIDWIMGSGNHSRVYLYQTEAGELYQLPLAWYSQEGGFWAMAPGFDRRFHEGVSRIVRRECMFCHNAYPNVPKGSDIFEAPQVFPKELPEGTGCQRCHGPGAEHVRTVFKGDFDTERIRAAIVNPKRLSPKRRNDICYECHMQPAVSLFGVRRFGVPDYSFRPGQKLGDYLLHMDITEEGKEKPERFEINHHPYRMEQSKCFIASKGKLSCLTCHNPHRKVAPEKRAEHYRNACLTCHKPHQCPDEAKKSKGDQMGDCAACHMPVRRTQDVVKVIMTDHLIQRKPESEKTRLAPLKEHLPIITDAQFLDPASAPPGDMGQLYRTVSILRAGGGKNVLDRLRMLLQKIIPKEISPYLDMAKGLLGQRKYIEAEMLLINLRKKYPGNPQVMEWLGLAWIPLRKFEAAEEILKQALEKNKKRPQIEYNLGILYAQTGRFPEAVDRFTGAIKIKPNQFMAWFHLGNVQSQLNHLDKALAAYKRTLEIEPRFTRGYISLARAFLKKGLRSEALRYLRHGEKVAADPETIKRALTQFQNLRVK
jgi:Tfp pilus assembly protein PilF